jgi:hypothetical protein
MPVYTCFLCNRPFKFGPHEYDGRHIGTWNVDICGRCLRGNYDGIEMQQHPRLTEHLRARGVPIKLNAAGLLDIPSS